MHAYEFFSSLILILSPISFFFFFNDTATTEIYTLSLHDALPIFLVAIGQEAPVRQPTHTQHAVAVAVQGHQQRSEEHTSELQSQSNLVCRLLLEKKKNAPGFILHRQAEAPLFPIDPGMTEPYTLL